ncbi:hypothetical protein B0H19DRAFT_1265152 [Mycena capillaripes]|nr:hypothetical protein B0H19DRAFT_1265152 [Mycena capillaripes]
MPQKDKEAERECRICFELTVAPVRILCCAHLFCAEHISSWLHDPASDRHCPAGRAPAASTGMLALGHPSTSSPRAPPRHRPRALPPLALFVLLILLRFRLTLPLEILRLLRLHARPLSLLPSDNYPWAHPPRHKKKKPQPTALSPRSFMLARSKRAGTSRTRF